MKFSPISPVNFLMDSSTPCAQMLLMLFLNVFCSKITCEKRQSLMELTINDYEDLTAAVRTIKQAKEGIVISMGTIGDECMSNLILILNQVKTVVGLPCIPLIPSEMTIQDVIRIISTQQAKLCIKDDKVAISENRRCSRQKRHDLYLKITSLFVLLVSLSTMSICSAFYDIKSKKANLKSDALNGDCFIVPKCKPGLQPSWSYYGRSYSIRYMDENSGDIIPSQKAYVEPFYREQSEYTDTSTGLKTTDPKCTRLNLGNSGDGNNLQVRAYCKQQQHKKDAAYAEATHFLAGVILGAIFAVVASICGCVLFAE